MLYLDYSRKEGEWVPNQYGGRENLDAIEFIKQLNMLIDRECPGTFVCAEESTSWPGVTRPVHLGGLGFTYKWNMGWMHDMLDYMKEDPVHRKWHHNKITFSMMYAYSEKFILPFSHDEVVHGKRSMLDKMPGDVWQKHANLRALYGYMFVHPGKKLLFMGGEIGQWREWNHDWQLDWETLGDPRHAGLQRWVRDLNRCYAREASLWDARFRSGRLLVDRLQRSRAQHHRAHAAGQQANRSTGQRPTDFTIAIVNFTPVPRRDYRLGVPVAGDYVGAAQQRRRRLRRQQHRQPGPRVGRGQDRHTATSGRSSLTVPPLGFLLLKSSRDWTRSDEK